MSIPVFYTKEMPGVPGLLELDEENRRHAIQVLRMKDGDSLRFTDGKGIMAEAVLTETGKRSAQAKIISVHHHPKPTPQRMIALSLLKNPARFEWFLEKATELGISSIIPLICARTEKEKFRSERLRQILVSAMIQSQQVWMPELQDPVPFDKFLEEMRSFHGSKFIAHCVDEKKTHLGDEIDAGDAILMIGPEGDFSNAEISTALQQGFKPVTLGETRLRSETAAMAAAVLLKIGKR